MYGTFMRCVFLEEEMRKYHRKRELKREKSRKEGACRRNWKRKQRWQINRMWCVNHPTRIGTFFSLFSLQFFFLAVNVNVSYETTSIKLFMHLFIVLLLVFSHFIFCCAFALLWLAVTMWFRSNFLVSNVTCIFA